MNPFHFREFNWVSMSKIPGPLLQMDRVELGAWQFIFFPLQRKLYILSVSFLIYFGKVYTSTMYHRSDKRIWFTIISLPLKEILTLFQTWICFCYNFTYFASVGVIKDNSKYFNRIFWPFHLSLLINSIFICSSP